MTHLEWEELQVSVEDAVRSQQVGGAAGGSAYSHLKMIAYPQRHQLLLR